MIFKHDKIIIKINNEKYFQVLMSCASDLYTKKNNDVYSSINPFGVLLFSNNWKWNHPIPSSLKNKINHNNPSPSLKQDIILWFQKLSNKEKLTCISINNSKFVSTFIKMLPFRAKNRIFNLIQEKYIETIPFGQEDSFFDILLKQMRVCWLSQAVIYFNNADLMDIRMLNWLNSVSNNKIFQYAQKGRQQQCNLLWFNKSSYHYLQNWLANQFQTSIIKNYFNKHLSNGYLLQFKAYLIGNCKNPEKEFIEMTFQSILSKTEVEMSIIKSKMKQYEDRYGQIRQRQLIENMQSIEQNKKRNKKRNKKKNLHHKYKEVQHNRCTGQDLQNQQVQQVKLSQIREIQDKIQIHEDINSSDIRQNYVNTKTPEKIKEKSPIKVQKDIQNQQQIKQSLISSPQTKKTSKNLIYISPKRTRSPDNIPSSKTTFQNYDMKQKYSEQDKQSIKVVQQSSQNNYSFESKSNQQGDIMNKKKRRRCKKQNEQFIEIRKTIWKKMLSRQLNQQVDQLSIETNALYNLKIIAFERVRVFIQSIYPLVNTILFGSNAIGLSLPNSDVDILLIGLPCTYREQASDILAQIAVQINAMGWIISCSTYLGAKVPLIKLEIDPSISFLQTKRKKDLFRVYNPMALYHLDTDQCQKGQTIKVDITINVEGISSIGYESTILMKNWLQKIPQIRSILILFKYILSIRNFNSNFNGGIGSYCLFSMIAAFIKEYNHESNIQMNFINLLKWYGQQFDNLTNVVWLRQQGSCFVRQQQLNLVIEDNKKSLLKLMDPISNKIMNSSCNEYNNIKAEFRRILTQLLQLQDKIDLQMKQEGATLLQLTKMMQSKKGVDRWITKFQNKYGNSVRYIINRHS